MVTGADYPPAQGRREACRNPYAQFAAGELILRDQLAIDRTVLANERTLLAYARTSLALVLTGAGAVKLLESLASQVAGWTLISLGVAVVLIGVWRYRAMARRMRAAGGQPPGGAGQPGACPTPCRDPGSAHRSHEPGPPPGTGPESA